MNDTIERSQTHATFVIARTYSAPVEAVWHALSDNDALDSGLKLRVMVLPDLFLDQDSPAAMYAKAGLDAKGIVRRVFEALGKDAAPETVKLA